MPRDPYPVTFSVEYPDRKLSRLSTAFRLFAAIPIVVLAMLFATAFAVLRAWFAILLTGRYPRSIFSFVEGVLRWTHRVTGYGYTLVTDRYPPFRLSP